MPCDRAGPPGGSWKTGFAGGAVGPAIANEITKYESPFPSPDSSELHGGALLGTCHGISGIVFGVFLQDELWNPTEAFGNHFRGWFCAGVVFSTCLGTLCFASACLLGAFGSDRWLCLRVASSFPIFGLSIECPEFAPCLL